MTEKDISIVESELNIVLPESYRTIIHEMKLQRTDIGHIIIDNPKKVIEVNRRLRKTGIYGSVPLRQEHFVFSYDKNGCEYHFIDTTQSDSDVYLVNRSKMWSYVPDNLPKISRGMTLERFINYLYRLYSESDDRQAESYSNQEKASLIMETLLATQKMIQKNKNK